MDKFFTCFFNGKEYRGVFYPNDIQTTDLYKQALEFGQITLKTIIADKNLNTVLSAKDKKLFVSNIGRLGKADSNKVAFKLSISSKIIEKPIFCTPVSVYFPKIKDICQWNEIAQTIFEEEGIYGVYGLKDKSILDNLLWSINQNSIIFGINRFPTICDKAAHIWYQIARFQAFNNGNKRTAFIATTIFLKNNFLIFDLSSFDSSNNMEKELYSVSRKIAQGQYSEKNVKKFIISHVKINFDRVQLYFKLLVKNQKK